LELRHKPVQDFSRTPDRGIFVRHFKQSRIDQHLRITVGTDYECDALVGALRDLFASRHGLGD
jgi:histidinol-phosphate aminotransferase